MESLKEEEREGFSREALRKAMREKSGRLTEIQKREVLRRIRNLTALMNMHETELSYICNHMRLPPNCVQRLTDSDAIARMSDLTVSDIDWWAPGWRGEDEE